VAIFLDVPAEKQKEKLKEMFDEEKSSQAIEDLELKFAQLEKHFSETNRVKKVTIFFFCSDLSLPIFLFSGGCNPGPRAHDRGSQKSPCWLWVYGSFP